MDLQRLLEEALLRHRDWEQAWAPYERHPALEVDAAALSEAFATYLKRLEGNYPFFHPRYAGQMLKPPHPVAVAGYLAAMLVNPNNHALDGGPPTSEMEKEVVAAMARMFGFAEHLGHLTSSGTLANLEALWVGRQLGPGRRVAYSTDAHYTHGRMSEVLGVPTCAVPTDAAGHMRLDALEDALRGDDIGTVVATAGTTGTGVVDPIDDLLALRERYGFRLHVDAAYGGFFTLLAGADGPLDADVARHLRAIAGADSVAVDPHKHGLQPYGCGCVLFRDPGVGRFYRHDSPYTYFTSGALHLGEISLECSRAGAAAGALWLTLQVFPLRADRGLGPVLAAGVRAARSLAARMADSEAFRLFLPPELDIVLYHPGVADMKASAISAASRRLFERAMNDAKDPVYLSLFQADTWRLPQVTADEAQVMLLRSVLMKPEHETTAEGLFERLLSLTEERP